MDRTGLDHGDEQVLRRTSRYDRRLIPRTQRLVDRWMESLPDADGGLAEASCAALGRGIRAWLRHLATTARSDAPTSETVVAFVDRLGETHRAATVALYLAAIRNLYRWAAAQGLAKDIARDVPTTGGAPADAPLPPLSDAEYARLRRVIAGDDLRSHRDRALLACLRAVPVETVGWARAQIGSVDLDTQTVRLAPRGLPSAWRRGRAGTATRTFALGDEATSRLHTYLERRGPAGMRAPLFISTRDGKALSTLSMRLTVLRCLEACGLRAASPGLARNRLFFRYPVVTDADLMAAERHLPAATTERARCWALLRLLALPGMRVAWERLMWTAFDARCTRLSVRRGTRGGVRTRTVALPPPTAAALRAWRVQCPQAEAVFADSDGQPMSHHTLKRIAWTAFPDRMPSGAPAATGGSSRRMPRAS